MSVEQMPGTTGTPLTEEATEAFSGVVSLTTGEWHSLVKRLVTRVRAMEDELAASRTGTLTGKPGGNTPDNPERELVEGSDLSGAHSRVEELERILANQTRTMTDDREAYAMRVAELELRLAAVERYDTELEEGRRKRAELEREVARLKKPCYCCEQVLTADRCSHGCRCSQPVEPGCPREQG